MAMNGSVMIGSGGDDGSGGDWQCGDDGSGE
jgi:hypothetical protein